MKTSLIELGFTTERQNYGENHHLNSFEVARIISEHKDRYTIKSENGELDAELIGNLRFTAVSKRDLPAVGDWVAISEYDDGKALIHAVYPRTSVLERKATGKLSTTQIIATNIDFGLIVQAVNRDFSVNRIERYLTICNTAKIEPLVVLSKIDLIESAALNELLAKITERIKHVSVFAISNQTQEGITAVKAILSKGKTYCLLGSSGAGKSTLINTLLGEDIMNTGVISERIDRGKHITSHRQLIVTENGVLIDNPGMREVGISNDSDGLEMTFNNITEIAKNCRFNDCTHTNEIDCAILEALENEIISGNSYDNFLKMKRESAFFDSSLSERKKKDKDLGRLIKNVVKQRKKNKF